MLKSELLKKIAEIADDADVDMSLFSAKTEENESSVEDKELNIKTDIKSDSILQITAAEFLQLFNETKNSAKTEKNKEMEDDNSGEIYI